MIGNGIHGAGAQGANAQVRAIAERYTGDDRSAALALLALVRLADDDGAATFHDVALGLRTDYLASVRAEGRDADAEAGRLSLDEVRSHLENVVVPRLVGSGAVEKLAGDAAGAKIRIVPELWSKVRDLRGELTAALRETGEFATQRRLSGAARVEGSSVLRAEGLVKTYRRRNVVNDVAIDVRQGEIVGLLGPNGAGKTTTFYMIVGLIPPQRGRVLFDEEDITNMPMYKRARHGIGYLSQEPSVFRKLTVEENILAILETLPISKNERDLRLEGLLDELNIKHLRANKAFSLSGGERRRLEITRALVTQPKFMMLDEPFAGVDPIAVHDIQQIVSSLKHRGIGVMISDHNVEQTLDIVDRAYILFDGQVKVSGLVRDLVFDDTVADIYLGPTLTARLRSRFQSEHGGDVADGVPSDQSDRIASGAGGMKGGLSQSLRLGQELKINPRLYQAMDMLYMPLLDLQQHLKQELLTNPFLDMLEDDEEEQGAEEEAEAELEASPDVAVEEPNASTDDETNWEEILLDGFESAGGMSEQRDDREQYESVSVGAQHLDDHLLEQIKLLDLNPRQLLLAEEFIGNINDDGYLAASLEEILTGINEVVAKAAEAAGRDDEELPFYTMAEAEAMLTIIQRLDPPGIGARDLRECLLMQLLDAGRTGTLAERMVRDFFQELIAHRWSDVARKVGVTTVEVQHAADEIAKLNPKPGLAQSGKQDNYVVPDMVVDKIDGQYMVFVNDGNLPRLKLSRIYQDIARDKKKFDGENKEFITNKLNAAQWLIQAIEQRRHTMLKVMHFIVDRQREFFEKGVQYLKPLTLREVADAIGMHESTVSRVTNEKYAQTPRGVLPLKFFFSSGLATTDGEDVSARGIKDTISKLVGDEDPKNPLTDQAIVEILERDGVQIARRTVAKYREQLGVLSARMRKRV